MVDIEALGKPEVAPNHQKKRPKSDPQPKRQMNGGLRVGSAANP
jgi:hypothetical protein